MKKLLYLISITFLCSCNHTMYIEQKQVITVTDNNIKFTPIEPFHAATCKTGDTVIYISKTRGIKHKNLSK